MRFLPLLEGGLLNRAGRRGLAGETDSQFTLQGWLPETANRVSRRELRTQSASEGRSLPPRPPRETNSWNGNPSGFDEDWEEYQKFQDFLKWKKGKQEVSAGPSNPNGDPRMAPQQEKSDSAQASSPLQREARPPDIARPRTSERMWQDYGRPRTGEPNEAYPFDRMEQPPIPAPPMNIRPGVQENIAHEAGQLRETSPPQPRQVASSPDPPPSPGGSDDFAPATPRPEERRKEGRFTEDPEGSRRTPRLFQPIKVTTYKGTKKDEGFGAHRFIKRMETYLRNTPGLTQGQMGLTLFHNLGEGAQDWIQSADDAYMDKTGDSPTESLGRAEGEIPRGFRQVRPRGKHRQTRTGAAG